MLQPEAIVLRSATSVPVSARRSVSAAPHVADVALFAVLFCAYLAAGAYLVFAVGSVPVDTWARVGNAYYTLYSRDPHLAAIGFVLSPVPTVAIIPLLPFKALWPPLVANAFAANITSAAFMAASVVLVARTLDVLAVPPIARRLLVAAFAIHPMIVYYGSNGLTEAPFVFTLAVCCLALVRWLDSGRLRDLVTLGLGLGLAYLTRYEAIAAAPLVVAIVALVSYARFNGDSRSRRTAAIADAIVVGTPFVAAFVLWALASWIIVGSPFAHFTSIYGNSSQIEVLRPYVAEQTGQGTARSITYVAQQVLGLAPALPFLAVVAAVRSGARRDARLLAPLAAFGGPLAFSVLGFLAGATVGFLRYEIAAIPLAIILAGACVARSSPAVPAVHGPIAGMLPAIVSSRLATLRGAAQSIAGASRTGRRLPRVPALVARLSWPPFVAATVISVALALPASYLVLRDPLLAREEADQLRPVIGNDPSATATSFVVANSAQARQIASFLDSLDAPRGSILLDVALGNAIVLQSLHPDRFVITTDRDFERAVDSPAVFGIRYLVVSQNSGEGSLDALNRRYPGLYANGAGIAKEVRSFDVPGASGWRVFEVTGK